LVDLTQDEANNDVKFLDIGGLTAGCPPAYDVQSLRKLAELFNLERTPHWYTSFGWILMLGHEYDEASVQFKHALEFDKNSWKALQGLSKCLVEQKDYDEAASRLREAFDVVPESLRPFSDLGTELTNVILSKKDYKTAFNYAKDAYTADPKNSPAISLYVSSLYALGDYQGISDIIQDLKQRTSIPIPDDDETREEWNDIDFISLRNVHDEIGRALWHV
jgi:tetratricopeptide (TPR) repeat protein